MYGTDAVVERFGYLFPTQINLPQVAMLGMLSIKDKSVVVNKRITIHLQPSVGREAITLLSK